MQEPSKWNTGSGSDLPIIPGTPDEESDNYAKWHGFNAWDDDIKY